MADILTIADLVPDPRNTRKHGPRNLGVIAGSLREFGAARGIVIDESGTVLAGNGVLAAAAEAGIQGIRVVESDGSEIVAVRVSHLSPEAKARYAIADNRSAELADWDVDAIQRLLDEGADLDAFWLEDELESLLAREDEVGAVGLTDPDAAPEPPVDPVTQVGDTWLLGPHRVLCGDSTNPEHVRRLMGGERSRLMPTDPPYLINYQGGNHPQSWSNKQEVKDKHWDDYREADGEAFFAGFLRVALDEALTTHPAIYQFLASIRHAMVERAWRECGLLLHQQLIWMKSRAVLTHSHYMWQHEPCFYGWVQGKQPKRKPPANATTIMQVDQVGEGPGLHPTQKPVELIRRMVLYHTVKNDVVYEPFGGSGTALIACELLGRRCFAMELAPEYCDVIVQRWEAFTGRVAERG